MAPKTKSRLLTQQGDCMEFKTYALTENQLRTPERLVAGSNRCAVYRLEGAFDQARLISAIEDTIRRCPPFS